MYACVCVCASQCLPLGVCVPAFLSSCTPASTHMCVRPLHRAVSHQLTQLSPRGRGPFLLRKLSDSPPLCVHTCRGCVTCSRSRGIDAMSFSRRFTGNFLEFQEFGGLSSGQRQKGQEDRKIETETFLPSDSLPKSGVVGMGSDGIGGKDPPGAGSFPRQTQEEHRVRVIRLLSMEPSLGWSVVTPALKGQKLLSSPERQSPIY